MLLFSLLSFLGLASAKDWAVIVAGSRTYGNYRHQADACHAYHVCSKFGIPDNRIIMMFYDDIADSSSNPYKGKIFNKPTEAGAPGVDVYEGCKKDYTGSNVTPDNFVKVLTGDSSAPGPVLKSTSEDNVFINFVDHGGTNIIAFPSSTMSSTMLNNALKTMHDKKMYNKLVFYMEACESGSMFEGHLPTDLNIYVTTASNAKESSWGTYCPPDDKVNGIELKTCLGDLYSVNWMENADSVGKTETLEDQFKIVKKTTDKSQVMQYGTMTFTSDAIGDYMGDESNNVTSKAVSSRKPSVNVDSRDIPVHLAYYNYIRADKSDFLVRQQLADNLIAEVESRKKADEMFRQLAINVFGEEKFFQESNIRGPCLCCDEVNEFITYTDYSLQYARVIANLCEVSTSAAIIQALKTAVTLEQ